MHTTIHRINPLTDPRWPDLLARHPQSSVFHSQGWLKALCLTYGYEPVVFTTTPPQEKLKNGIVLCKIRSFLTGRRMVSLPFSDHCQPLVNDEEDLASLIIYLQGLQALERWKYAEVRPASLLSPGLQAHVSLFKGKKFYLHTLDLRPDLESLFQRLHKSCIQCKIHRAEREKLVYEEGRSEALLDKFYDLLLLTRRRHQLPPQPIAWFRNLVGCIGDDLTIRLALKDGQPVASILTIRYKNSLVYKYGCSDARFHNLGGMPFLFWKAIEAGKKAGAEQFDLGRSEVDNKGLVSFKGHLGATCSILSYLRYPEPQIDSSFSPCKSRIARVVFSGLPDALLGLAGRSLYRHVG